MSNTAYYFHAERQWINAENNIFNPATRRIDRDRFFVFHDQNLVGDQFSATWRHGIFGLDNRVLVGIDYSHLDFIRTRGFPDGDSVDSDPLQPPAIITSATSPTWASVREALRCGGEPHLFHPEGKPPWPGNARPSLRHRAKSCWN